MSALDDLLGEFESNAGTMPQVNPPEAAKVLATQTTPEVAGEPEPPAQEEAPPAPTEKPADVKAAEAARTRKPRAPKPPASAAPAGWDTSTAAPSDEDASVGLAARDLAKTLAQVQSILPSGVQLTLTVTGRG
jgi:hypothetical protein